MKAFPSLYVHFQKVDDLSDPRIIANTHTGMDLRDYFAAQILMAMVPDALQGIANGKMTADRTCNAAYKWADFMMEARRK